MAHRNLKLNGPFLESTDLTTLTISPLSLVNTLEYVSPASSPALYNYKFQRKLIRFSKLQYYYAKQFSLIFPSHIRI